MIRVKVDCRTCSGRGWVKYEGLAWPTTCPTCRGKVEASVRELVSVLGVNEYAIRSALACRPIKFKGPELLDAIARQFPHVLPELVESADA